jgi:hypothetical protein
LFLAYAPQVWWAKDFCEGTLADAANGRNETPHIAHDKHKVSIVTIEVVITGKKTGRTRIRARSILTFINRQRSDQLTNKGFLKN